MNDKIKTLLFDLGGVIINLDTSKTIEAFAELGDKGTSEVEQAWHQCTEFKMFERGEISSPDFRIFIKNWLDKNHLTDQQVDEAWNAMILDLPADRLELVRSLKQHYEVLLLSNTNDIHMHCVNKVVSKSVNEDNLGPFFHRCYYSQEVGMRKPERRIYDFILKEHQVQPDEVLFLDDNKENIAGAEALGIETLLVEDPSVIFTLRDYVEKK